MVDAEFTRSLMTRYRLDRRSARRIAVIIDESRINDRAVRDLGAWGSSTLPSLGYKEGFVANNMDFTPYGFSYQLTAWMFHRSGVDVIDSMWHSRSLGRFVLDHPVKAQGRFAWDQIVSFTVTADPPIGTQPGLGSDGYAWLEMTIASLEKPIVMGYKYDDLARAETECSLCSNILKRNRPEVHGTSF
jgi:hypothetical protein